MKIGEMELDEAATQAAGNWQRFHCFVWYRDSELEDAEKWAVIYTHNRDSGLLDQSNANAITKAMSPFAEAEDPDVVFESHSHWAVGHVDGMSVRVFRDGKITEAFHAYHDLSQRIADYPVLDEQDYSDREYVATLENIVDAAWRLKNEYDLPADWEYEVYSWFSDNEYSAIENCDDQGGYPTNEQLQAAFDALGFERAEE